jgi:tripartite-type tricarboxylate transporter receptor subunit TctC
MEKDFSLVVPIASVPSSLIVNAQSKIKNMDEFIAVAKTKNLNCGTSNKGTEMALRTLLVNLDLPNVAVVPYKSTSQIMVDLLGGQIDCTMEPISSFVQHHESGKVIVIGNASDKVYTKLKDVPFLSKWVPNFKFESWFGIAVPNTVEQSRREQYIKLLSSIDKDPDFVKSITDAGMQVNTPSKNPADWYGREYIKWEATRHRLNISKQE